ncbi:hypothetical protein JAAARDRAFT_198893 [Jaapia argillacea MUCL 33604]|uniref:Uncharacterized protein n=1 Tax=Jaapia argillacea MUCL 33604 TaxID=933084 RepID=A0A067PCQ4_9AGAM|nr:hypothetical protein JAAARDRAFT_198893 [Jaapia argillacea MUCL 33604]
MDEWYHDEVELHDVFEPNDLRPALERSENNLGHLIFGEDEWRRLGGETPIMKDPLTLMFEEQGFLSNEDFLRTNFYTTLFIDMNGGYRCPVYAYKCKKQIWSLVPAFSPNSFASRDAPETMTFTPLPNADTKLFCNIVQRSGRVAIGPLKYCGHGLTVCTNKGKTIVLTSPVDPVVDPRWRERCCEGLSCKIKSKTCLTTKERSWALKKLSKKSTILMPSNTNINTIATITDLEPTVAGPSDSVVADIPEPSTTKKCCRLSADKQVIQQGPIGETGGEGHDTNDEEVGGRRKRRRVQRS